MPYTPVHAPIYGYLKGASHTIALHNVFFARTYSIVRIMNNLPFSTVINVGGAEGFHNHLFESEEQKHAFLKYIRETHPQFFRRTDPVQPSDLNHFTKEDIINLFGSENVSFFPQYMSKKSDVTAPIAEVRNMIKAMTTDIPITHASRIIALHDLSKNDMHLSQPRCTQERLLNDIIKDTPYPPMDLDEDMIREDIQTVNKIKERRKAIDGINVYHTEEVEALEIDEEGSKGMTIKWLTKDSLDATPEFCMREVTIEPGGFTPLRKHEWEHQVFVLEGKGRISQASHNDSFDLDRNYSFKYKSSDFQLFRPHAAIS